MPEEVSSGSLILALMSSITFYDYAFINDFGSPCLIAVFFINWTILMQAPEINRLWCGWWGCAVRESVGVGS